MSNAGEVASDQALTRSLNLSIGDFRKGVTAPNDVTIGTSPSVPALNFSSVGELLTAAIAMPADWDKSADCTLHSFWALSQAETNNDVLNITLDYVAPEENVTGAGPAKTSTQVTPSVTVTTANGLAIDDIYSVSATISEADANNGFSPGDAVAGFAFEIHLGNTTGVAEANLLGFRLDYQALY